MSRFLCDTSCLVAAVCGWHEFHARTVTEITERASSGQELVIASHSLVEAYAVLTRLPSPHRLSPDTAMALLEGNWGATSVVHLSAEETWHVLRQAWSMGVAGGQTYDAVIAACAGKAQASTILTWNVRHFAWLTDEVRVTGPR